VFLLVAFFVERAFSCCLGGIGLLGNLMIDGLLDGRGAKRGSGSINLMEVEEGRMVLPQRYRYVRLGSRSGGEERDLLVVAESCFSSSSAFQISRGFEEVELGSLIIDKCEFLKFAVHSRSK
jgi:hypothetical protein